MITFVVIGLMCNSLGCYWAKVDDSERFTDQQPCYQRAAEIKRHSVLAPFHVGWSLLKMRVGPF